MVLYTHMTIMYYNVLYHVYIMHINICVYIYIYTHRQRERERNRETQREGDRETQREGDRERWKERLRASTTFASISGFALASIRKCWGVLQIVQSFKSRK